MDNHVVVPDPLLKDNRADMVAAGLRGAAGAIPLVGGLVAEVVNHVIPNQRLDRIATFVRYLDDRFSRLEEEVVKAAFKQPEFIDLLEDSFILAARSLSDERKQQIAALLASSLNTAERAHAQQKRLMQLLGELNDAEVIVLKSYYLRGDLRATFFDRHAAILGPVLPQAIEADRSKIVRASFREHLRQLGLLETRHRLPREGQPPQFDRDTGKLAAEGDTISALGRTLLDALDLGINAA